jgi:succinoglycan biosynthesis protein ExoA
LSLIRSDRGHQELVSVVVPTLNEERSISICLDAVLAQTWRNIEVLVVDGGSDDLTCRLVEEYTTVDPRVRLVHNPRRTQAAAMNTAVEHVTSPWLVRVDAHSTVPSNYVELIMEHLPEGRWGGVGGRKDGVATTVQGRAIAAALGSRFGVGNSTYHHGVEPQEVDHIPFGAYPVDVIRDVGGWDEAITANEDFEFDYRVRQSGRALLFDPRIVIFWQTRQDVGAFFQQYRRYGQGKALVLAKHPNSASPRHLLPAAVVGALAAAVAISPLKPRWALAILAPYVGILAAATVTVSPTLVVSESQRWLPAAFAAMHLGYGLGFWEGAIRRIVSGSRGRVR